ncbi:hypothetical protein J6590_081891 [Homalodisca vitripennis]|nr:hypothetical protein J6590_081891 [Homalodisca vitripennis]
MSLIQGKVRPQFSIPVINHHDRCRSCWVRSGHGSVSVFSITMIDVAHTGSGPGSVLVVTITTIGHDLLGKGRPRLCFCTPNHRDRSC